MKAFRIVLGLGLCAASLSANAELRIAVSPDYPPYEYERNGQYFGYDIDVGNRICEKLNQKCKWVRVEWGDMTTSLEQGKVNAILSSYSLFKPNSNELKSSEIVGTYPVVFDHNDGKPTVMAFNLKNAALRDSANLAIKEMITTGELSAIGMRYGLDAKQVPTLASLNQNKASDQVELMTQSNGKPRDYSCEPFVQVAEGDLLQEIFYSPFIYSDSLEIQEAGLEGAPLTEKWKFISKLRGYSGTMEEHFQRLNARREELMRLHKAQLRIFPPGSGHHNYFQQLFSLALCYKERGWPTDVPIRRCSLHDGSIYIVPGACTPI